MTVGEQVLGISIIIFAVIGLFSTIVFLYIKVIKFLEDCYFGKENRFNRYKIYKDNYGYFIVKYVHLYLFGIFPIYKLLAYEDGQPVKFFDESSLIRDITIKYQSYLQNKSVTYKYKFVKKIHDGKEIK